MPLEGRSPMSASKWVTQRVDPADLPKMLKANGYTVELRSAPVAVASLFPESIALRFSEPRSLHSLGDLSTDIDVVFIQQAVYEHALVSRGGKLPGFATMEWVKRALWGPGSTVFQIHGRGVDYGDPSGRCLHLWRPLWPFEDAERRAVETASRVLGRAVYLPHQRTPSKR